MTIRTVAVASALLVAQQMTLAQSLASVDLMKSTLRRAMQQKAAADVRASALVQVIERGDKGQALSDEALKLYEATIDHCLTQQAALEARLADQKRSKANISAWGKLITLLGAVTAYAPGKTVLTGIGISGSDDSSVLGYFAQNSSEEVAALERKVATGMGIYAARIAEYRGIKASDDDDGMKRKNALLGAKEACDGLYVSVAAPIEAKQDTDKAANVIPSAPASSASGSGG